MSNIKVKNMLSRSSGKEVSKQFIITHNNKRIFQSYDTTIAIIENGQLTLDVNAMNYSTTTSKYLYAFTISNRKLLTKGIKDGSIKVKDLNK